MLSLCGVGICGQSFPYRIFCLLNSLPYLVVAECCGMCHRTAPCLLLAVAASTSALAEHGVDQGAVQGDLFHGLVGPAGHGFALIEMRVGVV